MASASDMVREDVEAAAHRAERAGSGSKQIVSEPTLPAI